MPEPTAANLVAYLVQVALIVAMGAGLAALFRLPEPRARLAYLRALLLACLLLPIAQPLEPSAAAPSSALASDASQTADQGDRENGAGPAGQAAVGSPSRRIGFGWWPAALAAAVLVAGAVVRLARLAAGLLALGRMRRNAAPLLPRPRPVDDAVALTGVEAEFRRSPEIGRPVSFGALRPVVLVPDDFTTLGDEAQKSVACHELVHIGRRDWPHAVAEELVRVVLWFHPALWWLLDQIDLAREQVVDREVVELTGSRRSYLDALVRLAAPPSAVVPRPASLFLRRAHLPQRVAFLVKEVSMSRLRLALSVLATIAALLAGGGVAGHASPLHQSIVAPAPAADVLFKPVAQTQATPPKQAAPRPGLPVAQPTIVPAPSRSLATTVKKVKPEFPPDIPGLVIVQAAVDPTGRTTNVQFVAGEPGLADAAVAAVSQWQFGPPGVPMKAMIGFNNPATAEPLSPDAKPLRVGGNVKAPTKIKDVKPVYPQEASDNGLQGVVILEGTIGTDGRVQEARVLRSIPGLDEAAMTAVLQWEFTPTHLNGAPVPVIMTVTVNFTLGEKKVVPTDAQTAGAQEGVRIGGNIQPPRKVVDVPPVYPPEAKEAGVQGVVIIQVTIDGDGNVIDARILRSIPQLDQAALDAVRQWKYEPSGYPHVTMTVTVKFSLQ